MRKILITGGAGFVGSNIAIALKEHFADSAIIAFDNLHRKGSELNIPRLEKSGVGFLQGDVRDSQDLLRVGEIDFLIECSAEPSVLAGKDGNTDYLIQTNLQGAINCADICRKYNAPMIFLSTSRVYPIDPLLNCEIRESATRFELIDNQNVDGLSSKGVSEAFPIQGTRSLYGGTKYAAEVMLREYSDAFHFPVVINRCGVIAGPWQFGKADQGIAAFWTAAHMFGQSLRYIGFEGSGKQVRDMLHIEDLMRLVLLQIKDADKFGIAESGGVWNVGGGLESSASLLELSAVCQNITGKIVDILPVSEMRYADIPIYITDNGKIQKYCGWQPKRDIADIIVNIYQWIKDFPSAQKIFEQNFN